MAKTIKTERDMRTTFTWGWNGYPPQPDNMMTRPRAANLLAAWRRTSRQNVASGMGPIRRLERLARGHYRVTCARTGEVATLHWVEARA